MLNRENPNDRRSFPVIAWGVLILAVGLIVAVIIGTMI